MADEQTDQKGPEGSVEQQARATATNIIGAFNTKDTSLHDEAFNLLMGIKNELPEVYAQITRMVFNPASAGINVELSPQAADELIDRLIISEEEEINPENYTPRQRTAYSKVRALVQKLYNEEVSANASDRKDFQEQHTRIYNRLRAEFFRTGAPLMEDLITLDAIDHPEKYGLRTVTERRPQGRPPNPPAARRGRPPSTAIPQTVTRRANVPENIQTPITAPEAVKGPLTPQQPTRAPISEVAKTYVAMAQRLASISKAGARNDFIKTLQFQASSPSVPPNLREAARQALETLGVTAPQPERKGIDVEAALRTLDGSTALADYMERLLNNPTPENLDTFSRLVSQVKEVLNRAEPETNANAVYVFSRLGIDIGHPEVRPPARPAPEAPPSSTTEKVEALFAGSTPIFQMPANATPAIRDEILAIARISVINQKQFTDIVKRLLDEVIEEYRKDPVGYVNTRPAIILAAFRALPSPDTLHIMASFGE